MLGVASKLLQSDSDDDDFITPRKIRSINDVATGKKKFQCTNSSQGGGSRKILLVK